MIDERNAFDQTVKNYLRTYYNIRKIATDQGDDYTSGWLLDYTYFKKYYNMIVIDLSKQQTLDTNPKEIQQINLTGNLTKDGNKTIFFIIGKAKETILYSS